jgi:hypothetical protein
MNSHDLIQGSEEWRLARCGSVGASSIHEIMARTKSGYGASRANLMARLIAERLTGSPQDTYTNASMQWGVDHEAEARAAYSFYSDFAVVEIGLIRHPAIDGAHCSPDGLIGEDGGLELKAPNTSTHINTLLSESFDEKYYLQCQWCMACTKRAWWDLCTFDPRMPEHMRYWCKRVHRDDALIATLEHEVSEFLREVADKVAALQAKYPERLAA